MPAFQLTYSKSKWSSDETDYPIYHFTSVEKDVNIKNSKSLRFTKNNYSNDDFDGRLFDNLNLACDEIKNELLPSEIALWDWFSGLVLHEIKEKDKFLEPQKVFSILNNYSMFVLSFSLNKTEKLLWYRYADKCKGVCLEFSRKNLDYWLYHWLRLGNPKYLGAFSAKVIYRNPEKLEILKGIIRNSYYEYIRIAETDGNKASEVLADVTQELYICAFFFKKEKWEAEEEFRIALLHHSNHCAPPEKNAKGIPYIEIPFLSPSGDDFFSRMDLKNTFRYKDG